MALELASESNPGLPPSSLMTWLSTNLSFDGIVLEEFDQTYTNRYYEGVPDDASNINRESIVEISILLAETLYRLTTNTDDDLPVKQNNNDILHDHLV